MSERVLVMERGRSIYENGIGEKADKATIESLLALGKSGVSA
jgi:hypothetical protein